MGDNSSILRPRYPIAVSFTPPTIESPTKSSGVVARITAENDRLRRELTAERLAREEAETLLKASKAINESRSVEVANLTNIHDTDEKSHARKERKIAELRAALQSETSRRVQAERQAADISQHLDTTSSTANKQVAEAQELAKRAEARATALQDGLRALQGKMAAMRREMTMLHQQRTEDGRKLLAMEIVSEQQHQELERNRSLVADMQDLVREPKRQVDRLVKDCMAEKEQALGALRTQERRAETLVAELKAALDEMKWVIRLNEVRKA